jgi:hypothetical protein
VAALIEHCDTYRLHMDDRASLAAADTSSFDLHDAFHLDDISAVSNQTIILYCFVP